MVTGRPGPTLRSPDTEARAWLLRVAALVVGMLALAPLLGRLYGGDVLVTVYGIALVALACEAAETIDGWQARRPPGGARPPFSASLAMRVVVGGIVGIFALTGITDLLSGAGGGGSTPSGASGADQLAAGVLLTTGSVLVVLVLLVGTARIPGLRALRNDRPITWFAVAATVFAFAQNLAPSSATQSVASTIARPETARDLIVGSLPYGAVALVSVGPVVRRTARAWGKRLGLLPFRPAWAAGGLGSGLLLVPAVDNFFAGGSSRDDLGRDLLTHVAPLLLLMPLLVEPRLRRFTRESLRPPRPTRDDPDATVPDPSDEPGRVRIARVLVLVLVVAVAADAAGLAVSILANSLPADCLAQQAQVSQSLSGGPTGRSWYENCGIALAAGIDEELLFRGVIQPRFGLVVSSLLFASFHLQYTCRGLPSVGDLEIVALGFAFGLLRQRGGLVAAILAHAAYDAGVLLGSPL